MQSKVILCFIDYYVPSIKAGGSTRSLNNLISNLCNDYIFLVFTRDRDILDKSIFSNILPNQWNQLPKHKVFYASPKELNIFKITKIILSTRCDCIYLNSFFSYKMTLLPLIINLFFLNNRKKVIVAPRGEFSEGALKQKKIKKINYLNFVKIFRLFDNVSWQASSKIEQRDIVLSYPKSKSKIFIASDFISLSSFSNFKKDTYSLRQPGPLRVIFLSRITPKKNLHFLLNLLLKVKGALILNIYGPIEDLKYWDNCKSLILNMPPNISVKYKGAVNPNHSLRTFSCHDVFIFPTLGENFGHVIFESLISGTSVISSNKTSWQETHSGFLEILDLDEPNLWIKLIEKWITYDDSRLLKNRRASIAFANKFINRNNALSENKNMFNKLLR